MIENNGFFMSEWAVSLVIAAGAWLVGYFAFIWRGRKRLTLIYPKTASLPMISEEDANKFDADFLLDLVKWAEMLLEEVEDVRRAHEKKALLMVSLSLAVISYLYSELSSFDGAGEAWTFIVYTSFCAVAALGIKAMDFIVYWPRGQHPGAFWNEFLAKPPTGQERKWALYGMLQIYSEHINKNRAAIPPKYNLILAAKYFLVLGTGGLLSMALESSGKIAHMSHWLARIASQ